MAFPFVSFAHQPRIVVDNIITVEKPEISKAYYGELSGAPNIFTISSDTPFVLYVGVLAPNIVDQKKDISAAIIKNGNMEKPLAVLEGINFKWTNFFEPFGYDSYWKGPEYKANVDAGEYSIIVWSSNNDSKYSLAIGEKEFFDIKESLNAISAIPVLKRNFFNELPVNFILSPIGYGYIIIMYILGFLICVMFKLLLNKLGRNTKGNRLTNLLIGITLLIFSIFTTWNIFVMFLSGFFVSSSLLNFSVFKLFKKKYF